MTNLTLKITTADFSRAEVEALAFFEVEKRVFFIHKNGAYYIASDLRTGYNIRDIDELKCVTIEDATLSNQKILSTYKNVEKQLRFNRAEKATGVIASNIAAYEAMMTNAPPQYKQQ